MVLLFKTNIAIWHQVHCCTSGYSILLSRSVPTSAWSFHQSNHSVPAIVWISPSVPPLPAYRCKGRLLYRPSPAPARLFLVPAARTLSFLERHFPLVIQAHAGGLFLFWLFRLFVALLFRLAPVTIIGVVARKSRMSPCPLNTSKWSTTLSMK